VVLIDDLKDGNGQLNEEAIKKIIPYEHPFLMIDKVLELEKGKIIAVKKVRPEEEFFKGHFVGFPIMPGALIVEGMGQAGTLLLRYNIDGHEEKDILAYKMKGIKFMYPTLPGDELRLEVSLKRKNSKGGVMKAIAKVRDREVAKASFTLAIVDKARFRSKFSSR